MVCHLRLVSILAVSAFVTAANAVDVFLSESFDLKTAGTLIKGQTGEGVKNVNFKWNTFDLTNGGAPIQVDWRVSNERSFSGPHSLKIVVNNIGFGTSQDGQGQTQAQIGVGSATAIGIPFDALNPRVTASTRIWLPSSNINLASYFAFRNASNSSPEGEFFPLVFMRPDGVYASKGQGSSLTTFQAMSAPGVPLAFALDTWNHVEIEMTRTSTTSATMRYRMNGSYLSEDGINPFSYSGTMSAGYIPFRADLTFLQAAAGPNSGSAFFDSANIVAAPVPEPASILVLGVLGLGLAKRRKP
jgi:hypothetical protein